MVVIVFLLYILFAVQHGYAVTYHVDKISGSNGNSCAQAQSSGAAKQSINAGIGCMTANDTLVIHGNCDAGTGNYQEILVGQNDGTLTPPANLLAEQPGSKIIPSGSGGSNYTTLIAASGDTPCVQGIEGLEYPGGGGMFTASPNVGVTHHVKFDGLSFKALPYQFADTARGWVGNQGADLIIQNASVTYGTVKGSTQALRFLVKDNTIGPVSPWCLWPQTDPETNGEPCPHGMYICGDDHVIEQNVVTDAGHTGIQVSCEQGGISNVVIRQNRVINPTAIGIGVGCTGCSIYDNVIYGHGSAAIRARGLIANNTIGQYTVISGISDVFGIMLGSDGSGSEVKNNIIMNQRNHNSFYYIINQSLNPLNVGAVHHNVCDYTLGSNTGCTIINTNDNAVVTNAATHDYTLVSTSPARGAGQAATGVTVDIVGNSFPSPPDIGAYAFTTGGGDTTAPSVSVTAPADESSVSAAVTVTASAGDNIAVIGVQFKLDGLNLSIEDTVAPYSVSWNTLSSSNGPHQLTAVARDGAGNSTTSSVVDVVVANTTPPSLVGSPAAMFLFK